MILDLWLIVNIAIGTSAGGLLLLLAFYALARYDDYHRERLIDRDLAGDGDDT
ncbi:hypothetical protein I7X12_07845 [Halosimplex litoreum]|uniref:Uncharacterized protein n=1 Tax=Halosimplex litoreum TaxID=1198301 RepID=A0A7T3KWY1_9EURY|nr:hypothetical protein [Halosimplex litoreum]QPV64513.1 hypothetical protein I7X12_07845 [Halosimplex litoreum]